MINILISTSLFYCNAGSLKYNKLYKNIINSLDIFKKYNVKKYKIDIVIYHDETVPLFIINDLIKYDNVILVKKNKSVKREGCFWRYEAYDDYDYDMYIFRDIDISLETNDIFVIENFMNSNNKIFYCFIVHPRKKYPKQGFLMGGMFGMKKNCIHSFKKILEEYKNENKLEFYGSDEEFLSKKLYILSPPLVFIEPRLKKRGTVQLDNSFFNKLNLENNYETYVFFQNDYELKYQS